VIYQDLPRKIGFWGASAVMVGIIIGSGIFRTPTTIAKQLGDPWVILALWVVGGVLSLFGAFTFAELATSRPYTGGIYIFLRDGYGKFGRCLAFVFGWTYLLITKPLAAAGIAKIFGENVNILLEPLYARIGSTPDPRLVTSVVLALMTWVNVRGVTLSTSVAGVLTTIKLAALFLIIVLTLALSKGTAANFNADPPPVSVPFWLALAPVMAGIMWTYDGWSDVGALAGEVKDPQRTLPPAYIVGTVVITAVYVAINAAYISMVPLAEMRSTDSVAPLVAQRLAGPAAATLVTLMIVIATLGSTHGSIMTGARVSYAQAKDGLLFGFLGKIHPKYQTPHVSLWFQLTLSITACWLGSFEDVAGGFVFTIWVFYGLGAIALFRLRRSEPDAPRPYKCFGYPIVPGIFVASAIAMTVLSIVQDVSVWLGETTHRWPLPLTLVWSSVLIGGIPIYYLWQALTRKPVNTETH